MEQTLKSGSLRKSQLQWNILIVSLLSNYTGFQFVSWNIVQLYFLYQLWFSIRISLGSYLDIKHDY